MLAGFVLLFLAFQAPEAVGQRLLGSFAWQSTLLLCFFAVAYAVGRIQSNRASMAYALERDRADLALFSSLFVAALGVRFIALALGLQFGLYAGGDPVVTSTAGIIRAVLLAVPMTFLPSIAEDMLTRGYLFRARRQWPPVVFVAASSVIYLLNHIFRLALGPSEWAMLLAFGAVYALALVRTGSLWPAVALHWGWNFANTTIDSLWSIDSVSAVGTRALSAGAHLVLAGVVLLLTQPRMSDGRQ